MVQTVLPDTDRTGSYEEGESFIQWTDNTNTKKLSIISGWDFSPSMDAWDVDRIDTGKPIYTRISDNLGAFSFNIKNLISLYDTAKPPTDNLSLSKWMIDIARGEPPEIIFAPVMRAVKTNDSLPVNPFINLIFTGRILTVPLKQIVDQGIQDVEISGEIINIDQIRREAAANQGAREVAPEE